MKTRLLARRDTTANWNKFIGFIPLQGEIIVYLDRYTDNGKDVPGVKIGDGTTYCVDLPFVSAYEYDELMKNVNQHIADLNIHVSEDDRVKWDSKRNVEFSADSENLIITEQGD